MTYFISNEKLDSLASTRQGRISVSGFLYQAAYAEARLVSLCVGYPCLNLADIPVRLRYDWGEDLDEVLKDGKVIHTQCKRVADIGQPANLAKVLLGFAPKLLWTPIDQRDKVRFRLVCSDQQFPFPKKLTEHFTESKQKEIKEHFLNTLGKVPSDTSDRALWQQDADALEHTKLFDQIYKATDAFYLNEKAIQDDPAGPLLVAEREALDMLLRHRMIGGGHQKAALEKLRSMIHQNLVEFDPTSPRELGPFQRAPREFEQVDVKLALQEFQDAQASRLFKIVDASYLEKQLELTPTAYVARSPEWRDVVRGADDQVKFVERDTTAALEQKVIEELVAPLQNGEDGRIRMLFVLGSPGAGKSTLARRVAAKLVMQRQVVVADASSGEPCGEPEEYQAQLERLEAMGRPVLLLLDDPLSEDSAWYEVLKKLNRPGGKTAVLAASPSFLYDHFESKLPHKAHKATYELQPPTPAERQELARLYGVSETLFKNDMHEEFLVLAMQAAAGKSFDEIIERIWFTLNGGQPVQAQLLSDLPVAVRAFYVTCFFHRMYVPCRWPILEAFCRLTASASEPAPTESDLQRLHNEQGWAIFRFIQPERQNWGYQGDGVQAMHQRVAARAWETRPLGWLSDVWDKVVQASVSAPQSARDVVRLAVRLEQSGEAKDRVFISQLVDAWAAASNEHARIDTRYLCEFAASLMTQSGLVHCGKLVPALKARAISGRDGWIAALSLGYLSRHHVIKEAFGEGLDIPSIIREADFSRAPNRATQFFTYLNHHADWQQLAIERLCLALEEKLEWRVGASLLAWLMKHAHQQQMLVRMKYVQAWLDNHSNDSTVRTQYLAFIGNLPPEYKEERKQAMADYAEWLGNHSNDSYVRTQYLAFIGKLPPEYKDERKQAMEDYAKWLADHPNDSTVRTQYLAFIGNLPPEYKEERKQAMADYAKWLADHPNDSTVRSQYFAFIRKLSADLHDAKEEGAGFAADWIVALLSHDRWTITSARTKIEVIPAFNLIKESASITKMQQVQHAANQFLARASSVPEMASLRKALGTLNQRLRSAKVS